MEARKSSINEETMKKLTDFTEKLKKRYVTGEALRKMINEEIGVAEYVTDNYDGNPDFKVKKRQMKFICCETCNGPMYGHKFGDEPERCRDEPWDRMEIKRIKSILIDAGFLTKLKSCITKVSPIKMTTRNSGKKKAADENPGISLSPNRFETLHVDEMGEALPPDNGSVVVDPDDNAGLSLPELDNHIQLPEVVEVFMADTEQNTVRTAVEPQINHIQDLINKMDKEKDQQAIAAMTVSLAQLKLEVIKAETVCGGNTSSKTVIEKQRACPGWTAKLNYDNWKLQVEAWNKKNNKDDTAKYFEILESLKTNDKIEGLSDYVSTVVCEELKTEAEPTVKMILAALDRRYLMTRYEKFHDIIEKMDALKETEEKDPEKLFELMRTLTKKCDEEKLGENINFFVVLMMMRRGRLNGVLSEYEIQELKTVITTDKGEVKLEDKEVVEKMEERFRRLKVEGKRKQKEENTYYGGYEGRGRSRTKFVPSASRRDFWRQARGDDSRRRTDARSQSSGGTRFRPTSQAGYYQRRDRTSSRHQSAVPRSGSLRPAPPRSGSTERPKSDLFKLVERIAGELDEVKKEVKTLASLQTSLLTEAEECDTKLSLENAVYLANINKKGTTLVLDTGNPSTLSSSEIIRRYCHENNLDIKSLPTRSCQMIFKFGESRFLSDQVIDIPIKMNVVNENDEPDVYYTEMSVYSVRGNVPSCSCWASTPWSSGRLR